MSSKFMHTLIAGMVITAFIISACTENKERPSPSSEVKFDDIQVWIHAFEDPKRHEWQMPEKLIETLNIRLNDTIVDIGAGTGYFTRRFAFAALTGKAVGLDVEPSMVRYMQEDARKHKLGNYEARVVKTDDPELQPRSADIVFLCNTYHHLNDRVNYFSRVAGALKKGGRLVIVDFYKKKLPYGPPPHHKLAQDIVLSELEQAGFRLLRSHDFLPYQYFLEFGVES